VVLVAIRPLAVVQVALKVIHFINLLFHFRSSDLYVPSFSTIDYTWSYYLHAMSSELVMSHPSGQGSSSYEPVSVHAEDLLDIPYYSVPPSPDSHTPSFQMQESDITQHTEDPPFVAPKPRFLGPALVDEGLRQSYASSQGSFNGGYDDHSSSIYALNAARESSASRGYSYVPYEDEPRDSAAALAGAPASPSGQQFRYLEEKRSKYVPARKSKRTVVIASIIAALILAITAIVVAIYFTVIKKHSSSSASSPTGTSSASSPSGTSKPNSKLVVSGGDGSTVTMDDGTTFTYSNKFGGTWYYDPQDPFNNAAQANSWTPPLNQSFRYGVDRVFG
jgi:glucan 1,3-beta-glucosidase